MFKNIFQLYKTGNKLGLSKKEINKLLLFRNSKHSTLYTVLLIISVVALGFLIIILGIEAARNTINNTYPSGTLYSTVKENDFKKYKNILSLKRFKHFVR